MPPLPIIILVILSVFFPTIARAEVISTSFGTGLKEDGTLAESNGNELRWTVRVGVDSETVPRVGTDAFGEFWVPAGTRGQWIHHPHTSMAGRYTYRSTPYLEFPETSTPRLQLRLAADDAIYSVRVNGQHQHNSITGPHEVDTVIVEEGLRHGLNELEIIVYNAEGPTALWCEVIATHTPVGASESLSAVMEEDMLKVSWLARDPAFGLTYNPNLNGSLDWTPVTTSPDLLGNEFSLTFPIEQERGFYRLSKPEITEPPITRITVDPAGPGRSQPVYLASNGEYAAGAVSTLAHGLSGSLIHRFDAGESFDPRRGSLNYNWKIFYPSSVNGGAEFTGEGLSGTQDSVLDMALNALPDIGTNLWLARLTVTSDSDGQPLSRVAEFHFRYTPSQNMSPLVTVIVNPDLLEEFEEVRSGCPNNDGCVLLSPAFAFRTNVFDASASIDPRGGTLTYDWMFRYPISVRNGAFYSHAGISINGPVATIDRNSFPDVGTANWRAWLTVTSTLPDGSVQSTQFRFRFQYLDSELTLSSTPP